MGIVGYEVVEERIVIFRDERLIIDSDVAELYGVETKRVNEAVSRNMDKFPAGYLIELTAKEKNELVANCDRFKRLKHSTTKIKGFTEKGLYMLATILKSSKATETTLAIIETFAKVKEVGGLIDRMPAVKKDSPEQQALMQRAGEIISDLVVPEALIADETEASIELNFAVVKFKYSLKKKAKK